MTDTNRTDDPRELLEACWASLAILSADTPNRAAEALRERIWAHLNDPEAECPNCKHYVVNHRASGVCDVSECNCQTNGTMK